MKKQVLFIDAERQGYGIDQIRNTMTVAELMAYLDQFDDDTPVYLRHDRGYTYGGITEGCFEDEEVGEEEDYDEDGWHDDADSHGQVDETGE